MREYRNRKNETEYLRLKTEPKLKNPNRPNPTAYKQQYARDLINCKDPKKDFDKSVLIKINN